MKVNEILLEYDRSKTAQQMGGSIAQAAAKETQLSDLESQEQINQVLEKAEATDPTPNKKYVLWIARQFVKNGLKYEDINEFLGQDIAQFHDLPKQRKQQLGIETDINRYTWRDLREIATKLKKATDLEEPVDAKLDYEHIDDMRVLYVGDMGQLIIPETKAASCEIGSGTRWCTAATQSDNMFDYYSDKGPLYVWIPSRKMREKSVSNKFQFHFPSLQFMDENDEEIDPLGIKYFRTKHPVLKKVFAKGEETIKQIPYSSYTYAKDFIGGRWPEGEEILKEDYSRVYAILYAKNVIGGRWPELEKKFKKDPKGAYLYANQVIGGRWPEGEEIIGEYPKVAIDYARDVIGGRWQEAEDAILELGDVKFAYEYIRDVIGDRWPEAEELIKQNPDTAFVYARDYIKGRWPEGEETIKQDLRTALRYAVDVIGDRWPEGEETIKRSPGAWNLYKDMLNK